jgi:hypothetical protein
MKFKNVSLLNAIGMMAFSFSAMAQLSLFRFDESETSNINALGIVEP